MKIIHFSTLTKLGNQLSITGESKLDFSSEEIFIHSKPIKKATLMFDIMWTKFRARLTQLTLCTGAQSPCVLM